MSYGNKTKKRSTMARLQSVLDGENYLRNETDNDFITPPFKSRLRDLFGQIEKEFDLLYAENLSLQEKIDALNEKIERDSFVSEKTGYDTTDFDHLAKTVGAAKQKLGSVSSQKLKTAHKLKAQTSKIVSSFKTPNTQCTMVREYIGHKDGVWEVSVGRGEQPVIGTASADHRACIWSTDSGRCLLQYQGHGGSVNSIRFHPTKDFVLTASGDCTAHLWQAAVNWDIPKGHSSEEELELGEENDEKFDRVETLRTPIMEFGAHSGAIAAADFLAGADQIITASWDRLAMLHDVETGLALNTLGGHDLELTDASTHPIQRMAVTCSRDATFRLWDFREPAFPVSVFQGHSESVTSAVFSSEDKVVSGSDDRTVKVWDLRNMRSPLATIRTDSAVNRLAVSENGVIAIPHDNRQIRMFDLGGQRLARLPRTSRQGHRRIVTSVAWANGRSTNLYSCGFDRRILGWSVHLCKEKEI